MKKNLFDFLDYKAYLNALIHAKPGRGRGFRAQLAHAIGCQPAFVSQVLQGDSHFNLEHGDRVNQFCNHSEEEAHFFLLLIQFSRAGTDSLHRYFRRQIQQILDSRLVLKNRVRKDVELSLEDKLKYYSAWYFGAIRVATTIPALQTKAALQERLGVSVKKLNEALDFLVSRGLLRQEGDRYISTALYTHLGNDSALISKHHTNWRVRAIASLEKEDARDLHYSSVVSLSESDMVALKSLCVDFVEKVQAKVRDSKEEAICSFCLDFYQI